MTIVSFEHGYLFIKTRKVAGTSVEAVLRASAGPQDVVAPLTPRDECYCAELGLHARNYARDPADEATYRQLVLSGDFEAALAYHRTLRKRFGSHMPARILARRLGRRRFSGLYRFSIERDPFSWLVSMARHDTRAYNAGDTVTLGPEAIREWIARWLTRRRGLDGANYGFYTIRGRLAVDRLLRFEHLAEDLDDVLRHLGIEPAGTLPELKTTGRSAALAEIYTPELEARVRERFEVVFELMGYPRQIHRETDVPESAGH